VLHPVAVLLKFPRAVNSVAVCYNSCSVLQHDAVCYSLLQCFPHSQMAAKLLRTISSGLAGRRLHSIAQPTEVAKLEQATRAALEMPHQCTYLSLATEARARGYSTV